MWESEPPEVALINLVFEPPVGHVDKKVSHRLVQRRPQLGLQYLAAVLRSRGISVGLWDQAVEGFSLPELASRVEAMRGGLIGLYSHNFLVSKLRRAIAEIRPRTSARIVVGGPGAQHASDFLDAGADAVVRGEAETVIMDLVRFARGEKSLADIGSVTYGRDGTHSVAEAPRIDDLDSLPFPDRTLVPPSAYHDYFLPTLRMPYATLITSRGCPYSCEFCGSPVQWGHKVRQRSVGNVLGEIGELVERNGVRYLTFEDDIFGLRRGWTEEFLARMIERRRSLKWMCILHPFSFRGDRRESFVSRFAQAGCNLLSFGLQSADPAVLQRTGRFPDEPERLAELVRLAHRHGILTVVDFIFGLPGETPASIRRSLEWIDRVRPDLVNIHPLVVMAGTPLAARASASRPLTELSKAEIEEACRGANRRFYGRPANVLRLAGKVLLKNPRWFASARKFMGEFLHVAALR